MALSKTINVQYLGQQVYIPNAYIEIERIEGTKTDMLLIVSAKNKKGGDLIWQKGFNFQPAMSGANIFEQGYAHLKTLPEFNDAVDI